MPVTVPLTRETALEAYRLATETGMKILHIARHLGCDEAQVRKIRDKKRWREATDAYDAERAAAGERDGVEGAPLPAALPGSAPDGDAGGAGGGVPEEDHGPVLAADVAPADADGEGGAVCGEGGGPDPLLSPEPAPDPFTAGDGRRDFWPFTLPPEPPPKVKRVREDDPGEPARPEVPEGLEAANAKVLLAARQYGLARVAGGYGGKVMGDPASMGGTRPDATMADAFVTERAVIYQLRRGRIAHGEAANTFRLTEAGKAKLAEYDDYLDALEQHRHARIEYQRQKRAEKAKQEYRQKKGRKAA